MAEIRTNQLKLMLDENFDNVWFEVQSFKISENQPYKDATIGKFGVSSSGNKNEWVLTIEAGRHKTVAVADVFKNNIQGGVCIAHDTGDSIPEELNFQVLGTLKFEKESKIVAIKDLVIAQGHGSNNNWWIGSRRAQFIEIEKKKRFACLGNAISADEDSSDKQIFENLFLINDTSNDAFEIKRMQFEK